MFAMFRFGYRHIEQVERLNVVGPYGNLSQVYLEADLIVNV